MSAMDVAPGTVVLFSDIGCPWATLAVHRFHEARDRLGVDVRLVHRSFPLEIMNEGPLPKPVLDAEIPVVGALAPHAFRPWTAPEWQWPVSTLPALEAVHAAAAQGVAAAEALDLALRRALFLESRCISVRDVILDVAQACDGVDAATIADALDDGRCRRSLLADVAFARTDEVKGSPHAFLPDGTTSHNPGVTFHWEGEHGEGFPVVDADDPSAWFDLVVRAAA
jgi:predicted DsbA family dithiol-disulfide isomerase